MALKQLDNSNISKHLGQSSQYKATYDPGLLVREPRQSNRTHLGLDDDNLPFIGQDTWNAYEVSGLTDSGLPITGIAKIVYPCNNKYIVESKSLKLYFNSFNGTKLGKDEEEVLEVIGRRASDDLGKLLECSVDVKVHRNRDVLYDDSIAKNEWQYVPNEIMLLKRSGSATWVDGYKTLEEECSLDDIVFDTYNETPELLELVPAEDDAWHHYHSALLKSNCRVTSQPDWGDVYIDIKSKNHVTPISLLKYIVSFRDECHFHEEICEAIYKRLWDLLEPEYLVVRCLYARRGGIDINPERASNSTIKHNTLGDVNIPYIKTPKQ